MLCVLSPRRNMRILIYIFVVVEIDELVAYRLAEHQADR